MPSQRKDFRYKKFRIIAMQIGDLWKAAAYNGKKQILSGAGATSDEVIENIKFRLDKHITAQISERKYGVPTAQEYSEAFENIRDKISDSQLAMLKAHFHARSESDLSNVPDRTLGTEALAEAAGYANYTSVNLQYGKLGRMLAEELNYTPESSELRGEELWTLTLATGKKFAGAGLWVWTMRPEVAEALEALGMV